MQKKAKVTLVILNYNGKDDTLECLASVRKLYQRNFMISTTVVDNASRDDSPKTIREKFPEVNLIENKQNLGFCQGNNVGVKEAFAAGADYVLILNNDTLLEPNLIEGLVKAAKAEQAEVVSPKIYFAAGCEFHKDRYVPQDRGRVIWYAGGQIDWDNVHPSHRGVDEVDVGQYDRIEDTLFATGCATLVSRKVYQTIGLYDSLYVFYFEDLDFSLRARKSGFRVIYAPQAVLWHKNAASFGGSGSPFQDYFITRNRLIFGLRYASPRTKLALLRQSLGYLIKGPVRRRRAIIDALLRRIPKIDTVK